MSKNLIALAFESYRGPNGRRLVLMALAKHANNDGTNCFPSVDTLAKLSGVRRSTVQRSLTVLELEGMVTTLHRGGRGRGDVTRYQLHPTTIKKGRNGNPFAKQEKGRNEAQKGPQRSIEKGRNGDPDSVIESIKDSAHARAGHRDAARNNGAGARSRENPRPVNKSGESNNPASREVIDASLKKMRELLAVKKPRGA